MNSGFGAVTSYSASQCDSNGQMPPVGVSAIAFAFAIAGFPPVTPSEADAVENVQLIRVAHTTVAPGLPVPPLVTVSVPFPLPVAVIDALYGILSVFTVHATPLLVWHPVNSSDSILPVTGTPFPPPLLVVLPVVVDFVQITSDIGFVRTAVVPAFNCADTVVPLV